MDSDLLNYLTEVDGSDLTIIINHPDPNSIYIFLGMRRVLGFNKINFHYNSTDLYPTFDIGLRFLHYSGLEILSRPLQKETITIVVKDFIRKDMSDHSVSTGSLPVIFIGEEIVSGLSYFSFLSDIDNNGFDVLMKFHKPYSKLTSSLRRMPWIRTEAQR